MPYQKKKKSEQKTGAGCICESCFSYTECMRADGIRRFCTRGPTPDCMFDRKGCSCPSCPDNPHPAAAYFCARDPGLPPR